MMNPQDAEHGFTEFLNQRQTPLAMLTAQTAIAAAQEFYREQRFDGCAFEDDADMLLLQWGREKREQGGIVWVEIVRQLMLSEDGDEGIWQMALHVAYSGELVPGDIESDNLWCGSLDELADFDAEIAGLPVLRAVEGVPPQSVTLTYENAG